MYEGLIIRKAEGHTVAPAFLHKALTKYPSCFGLAAVDGDGDLLIDVGKGIKAEDLIASMEAFKAQQMFIHLGKCPEGFLEDSVQPFSMLRDADKKHIVCAFVEGTFSGSAQAKSHNSDKFFYAQQKLMSKLNELWELAEHDLATFFKFCKKGPLKTDMLGASNGTGKIVLFGTNNTALLFSAKEKEEEFPWGWATDLCGYAEGGEFPAADKPVKKSLLGKAVDAAKSVAGKSEAAQKEIHKLAKAELKPEEPIEEEVVEEEEEEVPAIEPKPGPSVPIAPPKPGDTALIKSMTPLPTGFRRDPATGKLYFRPDPKKHGNARKRDYNDLAGNLPGGPNIKKGSGQHWKDNPPPEVEVMPNKLKRLADLGVAIAMQTAPAGSVQDPAPAKAPATTPAETKPPVDPTPMPVLDPVSVKLAQKYLQEPKVVKAMDDFSNTMINPEKLPEIEMKRWPTAAQQIGLRNVNDILRYPPSVREELCKNHPKLSAIIMGNLIAMVLSPKTPEERKALLYPEQPAEKKLPPHLLRRQEAAKQTG